MSNPLTRLPFQALPIRSHRRRPRHRLQHHSHGPHRPAHAPPRHRHRRLLHLLRSQSHSAHRDKHTIIRAQRRCQRKLQPVRYIDAIHGSQYRHPGILGAKEYM